MAETWWSNVSLLSKVTPRVLILSDNLNGGASNVNRSVWRQCTATLMSAQPDSLWLILVQGKTINTEPLMQCQETSLEATYWVILTRGGEWKEKLCVISILLVVDSRWADDMTHRRGENRKKDWARHRTLRDTSAQRGVSPISIDQPQPSEPCRLSTNKSNWSRYLRYRTPSGVWSRVCGDQLYQTQRSGQVIQGLLADWSQQPCIPDQACLTAMFLWNGSGGRLTAVG